jgi:hypothetical protein
MRTLLLTASLLALCAQEPPAPVGKRLPREEQLRQQAEYVKDHPPRESVGLIALTDLGAGTYQSEQGGLYPGGVNTPPPKHFKAGAKLGRTIVPLDAQGKKSKDGKIGFLSIGFSNPNIEFTAFKTAADADARKNPHLVLVNGCIGGQAAQTIADPQAKYWTTVRQQLTAAGVTPEQVQVIWMKLVNPSPHGGWPAEAKRLQGYYVRILHLVKERFPNLKITYLATRIYSGFAENGGSPEPYAYETGFAVKWVIADQIGGNPELNYDAAKGQVRAPWIAWGPYFWTDGVKGRKDGLTYTRADFNIDGMHPGTGATRKTTKMLMDFLTTNQTSRSWFLK